MAIIIDNLSVKFSRYYDSQSFFTCHQNPSSLRYTRWLVNSFSWREVISHKLLEIYFDNVEENFDFCGMGRSSPRIFSTMFHHHSVKMSSCQQLCVEYIKYNCRILMFSFHFLFELKEIEMERK